MKAFEILQSISSVPAISGYEELLLDKLVDLDFDAKKDNFGNIIINKDCQNAKKSVILDAHCDRIGFKVVDFYENGFLKLSAVGGIDARLCLGAKLRLLESGIIGVFSSVPPHLQNKGDTNSFPSLSELAVDTGLSLDEAKKKIKIGESAFFYDSPFIMNEKFFCSPALDNMAGCSVMLSVIKNLALKNTSLTLILSAQEEVGMRGARSFEAHGDFAICIDTSFGYTAGHSKEETGSLGDGAMIGHSPILDRTLTDKLIKTAKKHSIPYQNEVMGRSTGTNADVLSLKDSGLPTALISIPILNMHSQSEILKTIDLEHTERLISEFLKEADLSD